MLLTRILGPLNQQKLTRGQTRNSGKARNSDKEILRPLKQLVEGGEVRTSNKFPCLLIPQVGTSMFFAWVWVGVRLDGGSGGLLTP